MTIHTPRRRISPRTKRRCRAIKGFFRKALGTSSIPDFIGNSTIATSVADLKNTINGIEEQLHRVSKHCQNLASLESSFKQVENLEQETQGESSYKCLQNKDIICRPAETKILYRNSEILSDALYKSGHTLDIDFCNETRCNMATPDHRNCLEPKSVEKHHLDCNNYKHLRTRHITKDYRKIKNHQSANSCYYLDEPEDKYDRTAECTKRASCHKLCIEPYRPIDTKYRNKAKLEFGSLEQKYIDGQKRKNRKPKNLDHDFIEEIIERQYKPVKLFGRRQSDFSQFSAPVCRDQEFVVRNKLEKESDLCSCCFDPYRRNCHRHYTRHSDVSDVRSICDARLYSSNKHNRYIYKKEKINNYNDSTYYDVVPVKEKSSLKSRKKFAAESLHSPHRYIEVPPSPRTHRPRLNLKANKNYDECEEDYRDKKRHRSRSKPNYEKYLNEDISENMKELILNKKEKPDFDTKFQTQTLREDVGTMSNLIDDHINATSHDTTINTQTSDLSEKTLTEIKNILQSFLQELKKKSVHSNKPNATKNVEAQLSNDDNNTNATQKSKHSFNNCQCNVSSFIPPFSNPCCYPMLPICPMNCLQNGYLVPTPSYSCAMCAKNCTDPENVPDHQNKQSGESTETQNLIREIYKYISQNPNKSVKRDARSSDDAGSLKNNQNKIEKTLLTTRSVGDSLKMSRHDAYVGTPKTKCVSKSCEAIGARDDSDTFYTNASYSDTLLEKLSVEPKQSSTETESSSEVTIKKVNRSKIKNMFKNLTLWKKKKKDVIEELDESESSTEVKVEPKMPPYKQNIWNCNMHGQEFFHAAPMGHNCHPAGFPYVHEHNPNNPDMRYYGHPHHTHLQTPKGRTVPHSNYYPCYNHQAPQVPVCLKEIELKSIATQSERKGSILNKLANKIQQPDLQRKAKPPINEKPGKFSWKSFQEKAKHGPDAFENFGWQTQKHLAQKDMNIRNTMIKKLFYKKNPFSPRNLVVRTLLGKDPSSFGNPPKMYKPRMFL